LRDEEREVADIVEARAARAMALARRGGAAA
jgi:hypothetical protein